MTAMPIKLLSTLLLLISLIVSVKGQNIGIGTSTPQEKLDVNGAVKIGNTNTNNAGTIRYNSGKFEGGNGSDWRSFDGLPSKAIVLVRSRDTAEFKSQGYEVFKESQIDDTIQSFQNFGALSGVWQEVTSTAGSIDLSFPNSAESITYNNKIVIYNPVTGHLLSFDPQTRVWAILSATPSGLPERIFYSLTLINNQIFVLGGLTQNPTTGELIVSSAGAKYNLSTNTWTPITLPEPFAFHASCGFNNELWLFSGINDFSTQLIDLQKRTYKLDVNTSVWSADLSTLNTPGKIFSGNAQKYGDQIVILGMDSRVGFFNPSTETYTEQTFLPVSSIPAFTIKGNELFLAALYQETDGFNPINVGRQYKLNLLNGTLQELGSCLFDQPGFASEILRIYTYSAVDNKFYYFREGSAGGTLILSFSETGSQDCLKKNILNTKLYYMRKL